jgi:hypothetical protein
MLRADELYEITGLTNIEVATTKLTVQVLHAEPKVIHLYASLMQPFAPILDVKEKLHYMKETMWLNKLRCQVNSIRDLKEELTTLNNQLNSGVLIPVDANGTPLF